MKKGKDKIFSLAVVFCLVLSICLIENIISVKKQTVSSASSAAAGQALSLVPEGEDANAHFTPATASTEEGGGIVPVSAEGDIGDWLLPEALLPPDFSVENLVPKTYAATGKINVLIYHTHTTEAYRQDGADTYEPSGSWRTKNNEKNIVKIGETLKTALEAKGYTVIHDTTNHEPPKLSSSYARSEVTMQNYKNQYGEIDLYIDVHRDAADIEKMSDDIVQIDGKRCAKLMFVVGKGTNYDTKPDFESNYALANSVNEQLRTVHSSLAKNIRVKDGRYNQHIGSKCLLVEVGHNANTLQDALNSVPHLANAIEAVITKS